MKPINNFILVRITPRDKIGNIVIPDKADDARMLAETSGIVCSCPDELIYKKDYVDSRGVNMSVHVNVGMELKEGDKVYFHFTCIREAKQLGRLWEQKGEMLALIHYNDCYVAKRGEDIIPLNGFCLAEPVETNYKGLLFVSTAGDELNDPMNRCIIRHLGRVIPEYKHGIDDTVIQPDDHSLNVGDEVILFEKRGNLIQPLAPDIDGDKKLYYFQRRDVLAKVVDGELISISDRVIIENDPAQEKIGSIWVPADTRGHKGRWGTVKSAGPKCRYFKTGDRVYFNYYQAKKLLIGTYPNQKEYSSIRERDICHA